MVCHGIPRHSSCYWSCAVQCTPVIQSQSTSYPCTPGNTQLPYAYKVTTLTFTVYPKKYTHGFCFAVLCCGYTLTDFPISIRLTSLALWQSNDCPSASKATLMNMDKYFMWIHYERLHNHNKAKHNKTMCIFLGIYWRTTQTLPFILCVVCVTDNLMALLRHHSTISCVYNM